MLLLIIYFSAIETLICHRGMSSIGSTSFGFPQHTIHDFQNTVLNYGGIVFDKCHKNLDLQVNHLTTPVPTIFETPLAFIIG